MSQDMEALFFPGFQNQFQSQGNENDDDDEDVDQSS